MVLVHATPAAESHRPGRTLPPRNQNLPSVRTSTV